MEIRYVETAKGTLLGLSVPAATPLSLPESF